MVPLGGLGEIGMNLLAVEAHDGLVVVDCGLLPARSDEPGLDYAIADFQYLRDRKHKVLALLLTHGHDDHVGAVPHFLREFSVPVYATAYTLAVVEERLKEQAPASRRLLRRATWGKTEQVGPFGCEFLRVTHSVPDSAAVALETPGGRVLITGDFNFDPTPVDGLATHEGGLARWGDLGVDLVCCDSTNALRPGKTPSERTVGLAFRRRLAGVEGRVYVATFSSHVHRVQQVVEASREAGRTVAVVGRSLGFHVRAARRLGFLRAAPGDFASKDRALALPRKRVTVVLAGAQGEGGSALQRAVSGADPRLALQPGDELFLSARVIPGCERAVARLIDGAQGRGCVVHRGEETGLHASGHPCADDLAHLFDLVRPRHVLPVHGERPHREALALLAQRWGVGQERVFCVGNGESLRLCDGEVTRGPLAPIGRTFVETGADREAGDSAARDRRRLGRRGVALVTVVVRPDGTLLWGPQVTTRGVFPEELAAEREGAARAALARRLASAPARWAGGAALEADLRTALRDHLRRLLPESPVVVARVAEIDSGGGAPLE